MMNAQQNGLVMVNGASLASDLGALQQGIKTGVGIQEMAAKKNALQAELMKKAQIGTLTTEAFKNSQSTDQQSQLLSQQQIAEIYAKDSKVGKEIDSYIKESNREKAANSFNSALSIPYGSPERQNAITQLPVVPNIMKELLSMNETEQTNALNMGLVRILPVADQVKHNVEQQKLNQPTTIQKNLMSAGLVPGTPEYQQALLNSIKKGPLVEITGEKEESKQIGKARGEQYNALQKDASAASNVRESVQVLKAMNPKTNATLPIRSKLAAMADGFDMKSLSESIADASTAQSVEAIQNKLVLGVLATQKGTQTDVDRAVVKTTIAGLGDTEEAFKFKNNYLDSVSMRKEEELDFVDKKLDEGMNYQKASKEWRDYKEKTPLVSQKLKADGLPVMFYQFKEQLMNSDPNISDDEVLATWREVNGVK